MVAGDIETNPGPKHGGEVYMLCLCLKCIAMMAVLALCLSADQFVFIRQHLPASVLCTSTSRICISIGK